MKKLRSAANWCRALNALSACVKFRLATKKLIGDMIFKLSVRPTVEAMLSY
jgi:hypothetical protein